ncbi:prenyltransferase [Salinarchaeum sp. Harcht-Bsk1]|uniref:geranylgeranylglycerol-phosphate geranylgeranyltransferase n=1 Tax=Salinarchaeum sp. Harcht-Bsk1 TaxID=1333523 RepID=UPI0003422A0F|nr:geranylgeranylglycerol-phosphate geranylgeranyltransferase [Salinarchaeum sp. Harcht-Bsk1]AGN02882.1 prenyltransferase [Salinarchaeum sp. Harcht-Bsk1]
MDVGTALRGYFDLTRAGNAITSGVLTFVGAYVTGGAFEEPLAATAAVVATIFGVAAGNSINDYFDRDIDAINAPDRPLPRGAVSPRGALLFSGGLFAGAVVLALTLPPLAIAIALVNLVALVAYTKLFKGLPGAGNVVVAYLGGSTFLFGAAAVATPDAAALVLFVLAALSTLAREVVKDVEDVEGDRSEGLNTLPIAIGERRSLQFAVLLVLVAVLVSPAPYLVDALGVSYLIVVVPALAILVYASYRSFEDPTRGQSFLKYGMLVATLAFVVGRAVPLS